jgi:hypothetical protein
MQTLFCSGKQTFCSHEPTVYPVRPPKKYPYNNWIISIEGTFFGDTL